MLKKINWADVVLALVVAAVILSIAAVVYGEIFVMPLLNAALQ